VDNLVKQRVIGAVVLVALAVIFVPMLLEQPEDELGPVGSNLPDQPEQIVRERIEPLILPEPPQESEPSQVVLDAPPADAAVSAPAESSTPAEPVTPSPAEAAPGEPAPAAAPAPAPAIPTTPAEPVTAPPAPAPAPTATQPETTPAKPLSGWVVQLASLASKDNALALQERLRGMGYTAFVEEVKTAQGVLFRVRVGPELERANAEKLRDRLDQQVQIKGIVTSYP
jgi:DedD protein